MLRLFLTLIHILILTTWTLVSQLNAQVVITTEEKEAVISDLSTLLEGNYVFPAKALEMSAMIKRKLKQGHYAAHNSPVEFADQLTKDLQSISYDKHLRISFNPDQNQGMRLGNGAEDEEEREKSGRLSWRNNREPTSASEQ